MFFNAFPLPQREAGTRQTLRYIGEITARRLLDSDLPRRRAAPDGRHRRVSAPASAMIGARLDVPVVPVRLDGLDKVLAPEDGSGRSAARCVSRSARRMRLGGDDYEALAKQVEDAVRALVGLGTRLEASGLECSPAVRARVPAGLRPEP